MSFAWDSGAEMGAATSGEEQACMRSRMHRRHYEIAGDTGGGPRLGCRRSRAVRRVAWNRTGAGTLVGRETAADEAGATKW